MFDAPRIVFLENREKTKFWEAVSRQLVSRGCIVSWIIQNPVFAPKTAGNLYFLGFPEKTQLNARSSICNNPILAGERGKRYFDTGENHYHFYWKKIEVLLEQLNPDFVIGESTLVHELITIAVCAERGIPFLHPVGERYPNNRFAVFSGASQTPFSESEDELPAAEALELARRIVSGREIPNYMIAPDGWSRMLKKLRWMTTRAKVWLGRLMGEVYNTPSLRRKIWLDRQRRRNIRRWQLLQSVPLDHGKCILYPLQMQPENTIDVWGLPYFDQLEIIKSILSASPEEVSIAIKANPKPYYELSDDLLSLAETSPRLHLLPFSMNMDDAMKCCMGALTVTGTVGYEAVMGKGRCISVLHPVLAKNFSDFTAPTIEEAVEALLQSPTAGRGSSQQGADLLQKLYARSYPGYINDPVSDPLCLDAANISKISNALLKTITSKAAL
jgi:hypothetical protein